jgi:cobalt-zinc-cadmium efflux system membrane fusion protein
VLDDGGMRVVYVQIEGEAFERRVVRLGVRDGDFVGVTSGLSPSERVVSRGASR